MSYRFSLPSVTTVTGWEKQAFFAKWRKENPKESKRVLSRGNKLHSTIEDYLNNKEIDLSAIPPIEVELFIQMKDELDNIDNIHELETALWSETTMLAGRVDCVAEYNGKLSIIDFKGSTRKKRKGDIGNYFLQATAYAIAWQERTNIPIHNVVILISSEDGNVQVFEGNPLDYTKPLLNTIQKFHKALEV
jgi:genome maintenance exonuclease 1